MNVSTKNIKILPPKKQLNIFGYEDYFKYFIKLSKKNKLPNTILLSGQKGSGKATFAYHFINYLLSSNEKYKYSTNDFSINPDNKSYKLLSDDTHPNFFLLDGETNYENIKIDKVRDVLKFLSKTSYNLDIKIVLIDDAEYLNINSSNALLKALEEPYNNTYFFIIHNSSSKILDTIKSRSIEFKFFFNSAKKKYILDELINQYKNDIKNTIIDDNFYSDTPGNILRYLQILNDGDFDFIKDKLSCLSYIIDQYNKKKDPQLLTFISTLIEIFYNDLSLKNNKNFNIYFYNKSKILKQINDAKRFNLDKKNLFISLFEIIKNEQ